MKLKASNSIMWVVVAAALVSAAWASDVWKDKKPADWTQKQLDKFLTNSPWANTVQPSSNMPMSSGSPGGPGGYGGGGGGMGGGGGRGGGGGMGGGMSGGAPIMTFQIRWVSAPVMREALKVAESEQLNAAIEKYANDYYIIGVQMLVEGGSGGGGGPKAGGGRGGMGGGMSGGQGSGGSGGAQGQGASGQGQGAQMEKAQQGAPSPFERMLIQGATLKFGHQLVHPERAMMAQCKAGMMTLYMFPRSLKLEDASKDYLFEVTQGGSTTRASFTLKGLDEAPDKGL